MISARERLPLGRHRETHPCARVRKISAGRWAADGPPLWRVVRGLQGSPGVVHGGHCATQVRHPARAAPCTATPCLSAHTVPPLMGGARACGAGLCHRGLPGSSLGACGQLPHACALAHAPSCGAAIGDRPPLCFGSRPSRDLRVVQKAFMEQHRGYLQRIAARCVARHCRTDPSSWQH